MVISQSSRTIDVILVQDKIFAVLGFSEEKAGMGIKFEVVSNLTGEVENE